ncbi:MAG: PAS domain-containing protein [Pseudomonadota bacterium]
MENSLLNLLERTRRIGTWTVDVQQNVCLWSPATYAIHEEDPTKPIVLETAINYYIPEHRPIIERCVQEGIEQEKPWDVELQLQTARGRICWVRAIGEPVFESGELVGLHGIFEDIDDRKSLAVERETLLHRMLEGERIGKLGHWHWDMESGTRQWTPGIKKLLGLSEQDEPLTTEQYLARVLAEDRELFSRTMQHATSPGRHADANFTVVYRMTVGEQERHLQTDGSIHRNANGELEALSGVTIDRTVEFEARREINELNRRLVLALGASGVGVWEWNVRTDALIWDQQMYALYGIEENDFSGAYEAWQTGLHSDDRGPAEAQIQQALTNNEKFDAVFRIVWPDGTVRTIQGVADVVLGADGAPLRMIGVNWDITEIVAIRRELERSNDELAQFAYRTSHDLKGPLTSIRRVASYMREDIDAGNLEEAKLNARKIEARADAMEVMVLGILDAAKAELTETPSEPIELETIIQEVLENTRSLREDSGVVVRASVDCVKQVHLPYIRIYQILYNLVSNGIKYADPNRDDSFVEVTATKRLGFLELSIQDNGLGIPDADSAAPYEMFRRFHTNISGSGLGLYIVKKHIESLGGEIHLVTSDAGTRFELKIPHRGELA